MPGVGRCGSGRQEQLQGIGTEGKRSTAAEVVLYCGEMIVVLMKRYGVEVEIEGRLVVMSSPPEPDSGVTAGDPTAQRRCGAGVVFEELARMSGLSGLCFEVPSVREGRHR